MGGEIETGEQAPADLAPATELDAAPPGLATASSGSGASPAHALARSAAPGAPPDGQDYLRRLAARPPGERAQVLRALSAGGGNRSVSALVAGAPQGRTLARGVIGSAVSSVMEFEYGIDIHLPDASDAEKLDWIRGHRNNVAGVRYVWESFGDPMAIARANDALFLECAKTDKELFDLDGFDELREEFEKAVNERVTSNLNSNRNYVADQMSQLGIKGEDETQVASGQHDADADEKLRKTQLLAEKVSQWQQGMERARHIKVGHRWRMKSGGARADFAHEVQEPVLFDPTTPPPGNEPPKNADDKDSYRSWSDIKREYDTLERGVKRVFAESPAVFATVQQGSGWFDPAGKAAGDLAKASPEEARAQLAKVLGTLVGKIEEAQGLVGDDLDYRDFIPVHRQLMQGGKWGGEFEKSVIEADVADHEFGKVLTSLALSAAGAAGFLVAEFATAGMATFIGVAVGVGAGVAQAGMSIEDYLDKAAAYDARTGNAETDLVTEEQVDSALFQAILDTALAVIDAASGVVGALAKLRGPEALLAAAGTAGAERTATSMLGEALAQGDVAARTAAVQAALAEEGIEGAMKASGKSAEELAAIVGKDTEAGKKLLAAADVGKDAAKVEGLLGKLADFSKLEKTEAETVLREALAQYGYAGTLRKVPGGWKSVTKTLGDAHPIAQELDAWRSKLVEEMKQWLETASKGESKAVQTGTSAPTSDVDISTVGQDAAQNVERAKEFIAQRAGTTRKELETVLDLDAAVNPARMHLQDVVKGLSAEARAAIEREAARFEEGLAQSRRYYAAKQAGDDALMKQIESEAAGKLNREWVPLDKGQISALERQMDQWSKRLAELEAAGGAEAEKAALIRDIGRAQAQVLGASQTMYPTGGSIRMWVTERAPTVPGVKSDMEKLAEAGVRIDPDAAAIWPGQRYTAILGEGHFLDGAFKGIKVAEGADLVKAIKDFGKHGGRVVEVLGRDITVTGIAPEVMAKLADDLAGWVKLAKGPLADQVKDAAKLAEIRLALEAQMSSFKTAMANGVGALRAQAQLGEALGEAELKGIEAWAAAQAAAEQRARFILDHVMSMEQAARNAAKGAGAAVDGSPGTSGTDAAPPPTDDEADAAASRL
jgi:hypothetical protein